MKRSARGYRGRGITWRWALIFHVVDQPSSAGNGKVIFLRPGKLLPGPFISLRFLSIVQRVLVDNDIASCVFQCCRAGDI